jgi:putative DNA primase/helicase
MKFTLYHADCLEIPGNCTYPHKVEVTGRDALLQAVTNDYVCAEYQGNYRSNENFIGSDCLPVDCDNDHSDDPKNGSIPLTLLTLSPVWLLRSITAAIT